MRQTYGAATTGVKDDPGPWLPLLRSYVLTTTPAETIIRGRLEPGLGPAHPEVQEALRLWSGRAYVEGGAAGTEVVLISPHPGAAGDRLGLHLVLFLATLVSVLAAGAFLAGVDPFRSEVADVLGVPVPYPTTVRWRRLLAGAPFAGPLLGVLMGHEMGHWLAARRHRIAATLPFFIPVPPYLSVIGTLGAFIRLRGAIVRRAELFDIGAAGPAVSLLASLPLLAVGLSWSVPVGGHANLATPFVLRFFGEPIWLGNSVVLHALATLFGPGGVGERPILLHPLAFAGWIGLFVTMLNLLPLGQLDGGHVLAALLRRGQRRAARLFALALLPLGLLWWGWWFWAVLIAVLHRGRLAHGAVLLPTEGLSLPRRVLAWTLVVAFFLCFVPVPLNL